MYGTVFGRVCVDYQSKKVIHYGIHYRSSTRLETKNKVGKP
ncbi:hypothetical protein VAA_00467 [Vibrio anguillarum 775]|nr:hypothetical protein VAA_00467 [Vibrio anguillarum 775]ARV27436.1 hypothetical protein A6A12_2894 [Vibrio anguillarum]